MPAPFERRVSHLVRSGDFAAHQREVARQQAPSLRRSLVALCRKRSP
jgi:hypothetical protein